MSDKEVFVTYSWDNDEHCERIISFTNFLRQSGFYAEMDRMLIQNESAIDFKKMMHKAMTDYKKVIVVLSKGYKEKAEAFKGGVGNEYTLILNDIEVNKNKYILVSLDGINDNITPLFFKGREIIDLSDNTNKKQEKLFAKLQDIKEYEFANVASSKPIIKQKVAPNFPDFNKNKGLSLDKFCQTLSTDSEINILKVLELPLSNFTNATKYIDNNPNDRMNGVIAVYIKYNLKLFGVFDSCVHKIYNNGDKQYFLCTTTSDVEQIIDISKTLCDNLGVWLYDNRIRYSFKDISQIEDIANGFCSSERDECQTMWYINNLRTVFLTYHTNPLQQFTLLINEKKIINKPNISRSDSLLRFINFDLNEIIENSIEFNREIDENGEIKYVDYIKTLPDPFLKIFTKIKIKIFGSNKFFDSNIQTNLFFQTENNIINLKYIDDLTNLLTSIYGEDSVNQKVLDDYEIQDINEFGTWNGRHYSFDTEHRIWDSKKENSRILYDIIVGYDNFFDEGLYLNILCFDGLFKYMNGLH